jgi:hypothetical protein
MQLVLSYAEVGLGGGALSRAVREVIGMLKRVLTWGVVAFIVYYLATSPTGAANVVTGALDWLKSAGNSIAVFLNHIRL